ncbi:uncharacterized protein DUF262 [Microbacterium sp. AG157]|uniref:DUF262 domain-containing protein n=1 Tax=Microbacterium sp. AG157 TaxID=2183993 RepID=UPI000E263E80|nr:DUF262 domain-containing protein [Microbacterium sp. AG157]REC98246.1 uncharacterized protein DUF262 [Microbacterium sp. AG157]
MRLTKTDPDLESLVRRIREGELDLQPDFQRDEIWDTPRRQRLIDTILRAWYVPAIHVVVDSEGEDVVLDGQQRLAAIRDFFANEIRVNGSTEPPDERIRRLDGLTYEKLPAEVRRAVNGFSISVIKLDDYKPQEPNELFFRLNQSYNLTPPEKRNALHGEARDQVKELVEELKASGLLTRERIGFSNSRLAYDDVIARACVALEIDDMRRHINNNVVETQYRTGAFAETTISGVRSAAAQLLRLIDATKNRVRFNKGTLQTWLVYCAWAPIDTGLIPDHLLARFEELRLEARADHSTDFLGPLVALYDDRASYRVTDVSSVLIRDLVIHLVSVHEFDTQPKRMSDSLIRQLEESPSNFVQGSVSAFIEQEDWGNPIIDGDATA